VKPVSQVKVRELVGSNPVEPLSSEKLQEQSRNNIASPDKQNRVNGYMHSTGMIQSLTYQNNEGGFEPMQTKPNNRGYVPPENLKKEQWKPKTTT
jgi:hypothetical protein